MEHRPTNFIYRPTMLVCDGENTWEVGGISSDALSRSLMGEMNEDDWVNEPWQLVSPRGCQSCELCLRKLSSSPTLAGCKPCLCCKASVPEYQHEVRYGFCQVCDIKHYKHWNGAGTTKTFTEWRKDLRQRYKQKTETAFTRSNGLGCYV